jgi:hypothetical protein
VPNLIDSGRIASPGPTFSVRKSTQQCGFTFPLSLRKFLNTPKAKCPFPLCIRIHIKVLQAPNVPIGVQLKAMQRVYSTAGIRVELGSRENLTGSAFATLLDINVGPCQTPQSLTAEQKALYANRNFAGTSSFPEIVVYLVRTIIKSPQQVGFTTIGCAAPSGGFNVVVAQTADQWTLAHEVGHLLGLLHVSGENTNCPPGNPQCCSTPATTRLMTGCGTSKIPGIPTLSASEIQTMQLVSSGGHKVIPC